MCDIWGLLLCFNQMELECLYQDKIQEFSELIEKESLINYQSPNRLSRMHLSEKNKQKLISKYLDHLSDMDEPMSPVDYFAKFKEEEIRNEYLLTLHDNVNMNICIEDYLVYFNNRMTPMYINFNILANVVYAMMIKLENVSTSYSDRLECASYLKENMEKSKWCSFL